jgi:mRNA-degrading endonuclease RelE of RelBE toxin-antitoxin system
MYRVIYHPRALRQLKRLPKQDQVKITQAIYRLQKNPFARELNVRRFYRTEKSYRIRAGDIRAIYEIDTKKKEIFVSYLGYRGQVYFKL